MKSLIAAFKAFIKVWKNPQLLDQLEGARKDDSKKAKSYSHLQLLTMLQQNGRLIDFLKEDISQFSDEDIGASVRKIQQDCAEVLEANVTIRPLIEENEGDFIEIPAGYDVTKYKLVGNVVEAPFKGTVIHKGWKAHKLSLPKLAEANPDTIYPAEIEVK
ncbi:MAG: DUF2760 domain-containing protein [Parachlamydiaceae bacterium]